MLTVLTWVLWTLCGVVGLLLLILHTPIRIRLRGERTEEWSHFGAYFGLPLRVLGGGFHIDGERQVYQVVLFGLVVREGSLIELARRERRKRKAKAKPKKKKKETKSTRPRAPLEAFSRAVHAPYLGTVIRRLLGLIVRGEARGRIGFDDPVATAQLNTAVCALRAAAPRTFGGLRVDFTESVVVGRVELRIFVWLPYIVMGAIFIALSREGRALIRYGIAQRRRGPIEGES